MGLEVRSISASSNMALMEPFLNTLQKSWVEQQLGLPVDKVERWLQTQHAGDPFRALKANWYHRDWSQILQTVPADLKEKFLEWDQIKRSLFFETAPEEIKMIFYDWTQDPLYLDSNPANHQFLFREQARALESLERGGKSYRAIVKTFLEKSGLYERVLRSLKPQTAPETQ